MFRTALAVVALGAAALFSAPDRSEAGTVGIAPIGVTTVEVTADLAGLGLGGAPVGSATANGAVFSFPITGGSITDGNALIEHDGSGVTLFTLAEDNNASVSVGNFLIDTMMGTVSGDVFGLATGVTFFTFGTPDPLRGIPLLISSDLAIALTSIFGAGDLTGAEFGLANTSPTPVPLPAGLPLLLAGLGGLAVLRRKRAV